MFTPKARAIFITFWGIIGQLVRRRYCTFYSSIISLCPNWRLNWQIITRGWKVGKCLFEIATFLCFLERRSVKVSHINHVVNRLSFSYVVTASHWSDWYLNLVYFERGTLFIFWKFFIVIIFDLFPVIIFVLVSIFSIFSVLYVLLIIIFILIQAVFCLYLRLGKQVRTRNIQGLFLLVPNKVTQTDLLRCFLIRNSKSFRGQNLWKGAFSWE